MEGYLFFHSEIKVNVDAHHNTVTDTLICLLHKILTFEEVNVFTRILTCFMLRLMCYVHFILQ